MQCPGGECVVGENGESTCICRVGQFFDESAAECTSELYSVCVKCVHICIGSVCTAPMYLSLLQMHDNLDSIWVEVVLYKIEQFKSGVEGRTMKVIAE